MKADPNNSETEKIRLIEPGVKLTKPPSSGSGLKMAGAIVTLVALVLLLSSLFDTPPHTHTVNGETAANLVEELTKEMVAKPEPDLENKIGERQSASSLNGVSFTLPLPPGWNKSLSERQIFVRKASDSRICQITADSNYDSSGLLADVKGKESAFEAQFVKDMLSVGTGTQAQVSTSGQLLSKNYSGASFHYAVKVKSKITVGPQSIEQVGVNAVFSRGTKMVRLQCMNASGDSDDRAEMESIGKSLSISLN